MMPWAWPSWTVWVWIILLLMGLAILGGMLRLPLARWRKEKLHALFAEQQPALQQRFQAQAAASGKPRGLHWQQIDWQTEAHLGRERRSGQYVMLMGCDIQFDVIPDSDMEGLPAVDLAKNATVLFTFEGGQWHPSEKTIFNFHPEDIFREFAAKFERL